MTTILAIHTLATELENEVAGHRDVARKDGPHVVGVGAVRKGRARIGTVLDRQDRVRVIVGGAAIPADDARRRARAVVSWTSSQHGRHHQKEDDDRRRPRAGPIRSPDCNDSKSEYSQALVGYTTATRASTPNPHPSRAQERWRTTVTRPTYMAVRG